MINRLIGLLLVFLTACAPQPDAVGFVHSLYRDLDSGKLNNRTNTETYFQTSSKDKKEFVFKQVWFENLEYRDPTDNKYLLMLDVNVEKNCVSREALLDSFENLELFDTPHGHSENEETSWAIESDRSQFVLGFQEKNPDCLSSISFEKLQ